ncbi:MAG: EAL domain-containing protein [Pseudomonadota bacterium]
MNDRGIRQRVLILALLPLILVSAGLSWYFIQARYDEMERSLEERALALAGQLAKSCELALFSGDVDTLGQIARPLYRAEDIQAVTIADADGKTLLNVGESRGFQDLRVHQAMVVARDDTAILVISPVLQRFLDIGDAALPTDNISLGYVALEVSRHATRQRQQAMLVTGLLITGLGLTLAGLLAWRLGQDIVRPLRRLTQAVEQIGEGDLNVRVQVDSGGEFAVLEKGVNHMAAELKASYDTLQEKIRAATARLSWQATHDGLTGLLNRNGFDESLRQAWDEVGSGVGIRHCLVYLDLDQFKVVNDTSGHQAGDELLRQLAVRMRQTLRGSDVVARLGGDEFGVLLSHCDVATGEALAEKLRRIIEEFRFRWEERIYQVGASIGLVEIDPLWPDPAQLMSAADAACYAAKDAGRNKVRVYRRGDEDVARRRGEMEWVGRLNLAMEEGRLSLYYQPIVALADPDQPTHYELLLRLAEGDEAVLPMAFIPAAERYQLMPQLDRWVIEHALGQCTEGLLALPDNGSVLGINLSGASLSDARFQSFIRDILGRHAHLAGRLCFEITETAAMSNLDTVLQLIQDLKGLGCHFALDDFGSGLSSFAYLQNLAVDYIKIDGAFVRDMVRDPVDAAMVEAIAKVAHIMGIRTVAEYVEDEATLAALKELGVDYAQGNLFALPRPIATLRQMMAG